MITKYDEFAELEKRYPRTIGNDYMMPGDIRNLIERDKLTFAADERALFMFERREGFTKLHFRLLDATAELIPPSGENLAAYLIYREGHYPEPAADWLRRQKFVKTKTLRRHTAKGIAGELTTDGTNRASAGEVYSMLSEYFSAVEADMPCRDMFEQAICIRSPEGAPIGILHDLGQSIIIAVSEEARGQGVGRRLYRAYAASKPEKSIFREWISPENKSSLAMFQSLGFVADATFADCYVKEQ